MNGSVVSLYNDLITTAASAPLNELLLSTLRLAQELGNKELENWVRLEVDGYFDTNPALTEDVIVPKYRTVVGQHSDEFGRPLIIKDPKLGFINENRLRFGVAELEKIANRSEPLTFRDPHLTELIREHLKVEVSRYSFSPIAVSGVLSGIRSKLLDWLNKIRPDIEKLKDVANPVKLTQLSSAKQGLTAQYKAESERWYRNRTIQATLITGVFMLITALMTTPLWIPFINKIFGDSGQKKKVPIEFQRDPNSPVIIDQNASSLKRLKDEKSLEPEEKEADVNRPKPAPIFKIPDATITPEETTGEVNEPKKPDIIKRKERPIEPEDQ